MKSRTKAKPRVRRGTADELERAKARLDSVLERIALSERKFATMFCAAPFAIALTRVGTGVLVDVNPAWTKLHGFSKEEAVGKTTLELGMHPDPKVRDWLRELFRREKVVRDVEVNVRTKAGVMVITSCNFDLIELDDDHYLLATVRDVTEQRRAEQALRDSERHFRFLADNLPQIIWTADASGSIDYFNERLCDLTGVPRDCLDLGKLREIMHPDDLQHAAHVWIRSMATGVPFEFEIRYRDRHGGYRWQLARAVPLRDESGAVTRWFGTATDIQEQREIAEKLGEALRVREDFLAVAGHELKTPLAALLLHVQGLMRSAHPEQDPGKVRDRLAKASRASLRLDRLINELLDVSRITAGRLELAPESVDLVPLVSDVVAEFTESAEAPIIVRTAEPSLKGAWDRVRVEQVLNNLLENALKYGLGKPVEIDVASDDTYAVVRVKDHGIGISPEQQERIFERFERAVPTRDYTGLGLGLWISRQIVEASGGRVEVQSEPGAGATFTVRLPREAQA